MLVSKPDIFSDGATSQFKQRYLFSNLPSWEIEHDIIISLGTFVEGVVDGIGGTVQRTVWRHIKN